MGRHAIEFDNHQVRSLMSRYSTKGLNRQHPKIADIISRTIGLQLPRKLSGSALLEVLKGCKAITVQAAAEATGHRYARSTVSEYAMLARVASQGIGEYLDSLKGNSSPKAVRHAG